MVLGLVMLAVLRAPDAGVPTKQVMQGGFDSLTTLVWLTSPRAPSAERNELIGQHLQRLEGLPHAFDTRGKTEPGVAAIASSFKDYIARTRSRFDQGEVETVGYRVRTLSGLCFACHTRDQVPADFADAEKRFEQLNLGALERAQALAATRQFDRSIVLFREVLTNPRAPQRDVASAMDDAITIAVRAKNDPALALAILDALAARTDLPESVRLRVAGWRTEVEAWQSDGFDSVTASPERLLAKGEALTKDGTTIALMRASAYVSRALDLNPKHPKRARALWLLGVGAGKLHSPLLWDLDLLYFEACVRENPRSAMARQCFGAFEERLVAGFSGSGGTRLPADERARLEQLKGLAGIP